MGRELGQRRAATICLQGPISIRALSGWESSGGGFNAGASREHNDWLRRSSLFEREKSKRQRGEIAQGFGGRREGTGERFHHHRNRGRSKADRPGRGASGSGSTRA